MNMDKVVCECFGVTNGQVKEAVDNGATTLEEVTEATGAGTGCGACNDDLQRLVDFFTTERDS
ncbi:MAG: (2Fe-2S)-binding protein [Tyzzerella sp.]|nr:(2Fe-2S)-binding protein [Lachnospiraceae bacterium]MBP3663914.1 (2Fe-2S)-binding protein [Tyzzerella sp.]